MVRKASIIMALFGSLVFGRCAITEMPLAHDNPLDKIFDSGSFRLVLAGEATSATASTLSWGSVYYKNESGSVTELTSSDINGAAQLLYSAAAPSLADIAAVKSGVSIAGGYITVACSIVLGNASNCVSTQGKGYYIIEANYTYDGKSGKLYSNFVVVQ